MLTVIRWAAHKFHKKHAQRKEKMFCELVECVRRNHGDTWPEPRSGHRMCADDNYLYVFGGYDPNKDNRLYNELWRYNITTEKWLKLPDNDCRLPKECLSSTMLLWRNKLIIFGGTGYPFAEKNSNALYVYCLRAFKWILFEEIKPSVEVVMDNRTTNTWSNNAFCTCDRSVTVPSNPPEPKYGHGMAFCERDGDLYIFSGTKGRTFEDELHRFNFADSQWELFRFCEKHRDDIPGPRYRHETIWTKDEFYIFGGSTLHRMYKNDTVYSFNFNKMSWKKHSCSTASYLTLEDGKNEAYYPQPRKAHTCVVHNNNVYMVGGVNENNELIHRDMWRFSLDDKTWMKVEKVEFPREIYFHASAVTTQGCMYVFGGADGTSRRNNQLFKMWLCAPSLKEQAWLKIISILKSKNKLRTDVMVQLGVPKNFYGRLNDDIDRLTQAA